MVLNVLVLVTFSGQKMSSLSLTFNRISLNFLKRFVIYIEWRSANTKSSKFGEVREYGLDVRRKEGDVD